MHTARHSTKTAFDSRHRTAEKQVPENHGTDLLQRLFKLLLFALQMDPCFCYSFQPGIFSIPSMEIAAITDRGRSNERRTLPR